MARTVGVSNAPPVYLIGLTQVSRDSGIAFESVRDPRWWIRHQRDPVLMLGVRSPGDMGLVSELKALEPASVLVTLIDEFSIESVRRSLIAGASGAISRDSDADQVTRVLEAAMAHSTIVPTDFAQRWATQDQPQSSSPLAEVELGWLQSLAHRATVADLSRSAGYSEREMYRRLTRVYRKMGVRSRTEALLKASRLGWIH